MSKLKFLSILSLFSLFGCAKSDRATTAAPALDRGVDALALPAGFSVVERQPQGYFIRLASSERAPVGTIRTIAASLDGRFDRIDFCLNTSHERGDEYASVIDDKLYDYENDNITRLQ